MSRSACMQTMRPRLAACNGTELEDVLWTFSSPVDALRAALACREQVAANQAVLGWAGPHMGASQGANAGSTLSPGNSISGFGIHLGKMLFLPGA